MELPGNLSPSAPRRPSAMSTVPAFTWFACSVGLPSGEAALKISTRARPPVFASSCFANGSATSCWKKLAGPRKWLNFKVTGCASAAALARHEPRARTIRFISPFLSAFALPRPNRRLALGFVLGPVVRSRRLSHAALQEPVGQLQAAGLARQDV